MDFFYYFALLFGFLMGVVTVYLYQWFTRHIHDQAELDSEHEEGYTLTLVERPGDLSEGE